MCVIETGEKDAELVRAREQAKRRAEIAQKCEPLKIVDSAAEKGGSIYDVLLRAFHECDKTNAGAGDTIKRLLKLEGWKDK